MEEKKIGEITHYFDNISVGIIKLTDGSIGLGDKVHIKGATTDFEQEIESLQIEHEDIEKAETGEEVGTKVEDRVRGGDEVYKIIE